MKKLDLSNERYILAYCLNCVQMTNHNKKAVCQKCGFRAISKKERGK